MSALRSAILRTPLRSSFRPTPAAFSTPKLTRPLASFTFRPPYTNSLVSKNEKELSNQGTKGIVTSAPVSIEATSPLADGGSEDAPHHGINVDKPIRMDT